MNVSLIFLLAAVGSSVLGVLVLWAFQRRPRRFGSSIEDFRQGLQALAPPDHDTTPDSPVRVVDGEPSED